MKIDNFVQILYNGAYTKQHSIITEAELELKVAA